MARKYAGIMALMGMTLVLMRALRTGGGFEAAVVSAMFWMITFGVIGFMVASIARNTVDEAVRQQIERELVAGTNPVTMRSAEGPAAH